MEIPRTSALAFIPSSQDALLAFYHFPAVHWLHLRTNPIESNLATVRLRNVKSRGCGSRASILSTAFKLAQSAEQRWQKLCGAEMIAKVITGGQFRNEVEVPKKGRMGSALETLPVLRVEKE